MTSEGGTADLGGARGLGVAGPEGWVWLPSGTTSEFSSDTTETTVVLTNELLYQFAILPLKYP